MGERKFKKRIPYKIIKLYDLNTHLTEEPLCYGFIPEHAQSILPVNKMTY